MASITKTDLDILLGKGTPINNHPGNVYFRQIIRENHEIYDNEHDGKKMIIAHGIVDRLIRQGARFLKKNKLTGFWEEVGIKKAYDKAQQTLRDGAVKRRQQRIDQMRLMKQQRQQQQQQQQYQQEPPVVRASSGCPAALFAMPVPRPVAPSTMVAPAITKSNDNIQLQSSVQLTSQKNTPRPLAARAVSGCPAARFAQPTRSAASKEEAIPFGSPSLSFLQSQNSLMDNSTSNVLVSLFSSQASISPDIFRTQSDYRPPSLEEQQKRSSDCPVRPPAPVLSSSDTNVTAAARSILEADMDALMPVFDSLISVGDMDRLQFESSNSVQCV